jgi:osmotically-inducible protein OsmY
MNPYMKSDEEIKSEVCETLSRSNLIDAEHVNVMVQEGIVTLFGQVQTRAEKHAAKSEISSILGIDQIKNEIKVKKPFEDYVPNFKNDEKDQLIQNRTGLI